MEKILNLKGLGVSGRQNELIELALTFKFNTVEVDMNDLIGRHDTMGKEFACQFLQSAKINVGSFDLPIDLEASDEDFATQSEKLDTILSLCETLGGKRCRVYVATSSEMAFRENFERCQTRLNTLGDKCKANGMMLGVALSLPTADEKEHKFVQSAEELMTLGNTVGNDNVGICLDTWHWKVAGGAMDQIGELDVAKVSEMILADFPADADPANITVANRVIPGDEPGSFSCDVFKALKAKGYEGPISFGTHMSTFANTNRDRIINRISKRLDCLIAGESFETIEEKTLAETVQEAQDKERRAREGKVEDAKEAKADAKDADAKDAKEEGKAEVKEEKADAVAAAE